MSLELWLIRHGETAWNREGRWQGHSDTELSERGREQAAALGRRLAAVDFDRVVSSDLRRACDTARIALPAMAVHTDVRLREMHFGDFEGRVWSDLVADHGRLLDLWRSDPHAFAPPGGEPYAQLLARTGQWLGEAAREDGRMAVFTHGGALRALLYGITGTPRAREWGFVLANASLSVVEVHEGTFLISRLNDVAHLDDGAAID